TPATVGLGKPETTSLVAVKLGMKVAMHPAQFCEEPIVVPVSAVPMLETVLYRTALESALSKPTPSAKVKPFVGVDWLGVAVLSTMFVLMQAIHSSFALVVVGVVPESVGPVLPPLTAVWSKVNVPENSRTSATT